MANHNLRDRLEHLALNFTNNTQWRSPDLPIYERGEGCYLWDIEGRRWLDGLAGLFVVNIGHGRKDIAEAAANQMSRLAYSPAWQAAHPPGIEAAELISSLAPGDLDVVFFVSSGSEAVETAIKFARQYHAARGEPSRTKVISRRDAYHGTTMGALSATGMASLRNLFEPLLPGFYFVGNTLEYSDAASAAAAVEQAVLDQGPETVAMIIAEPVQNGGGAIVPPDGYWQLLREICDRHGILLVADEVINGFGRLGTWFGSGTLTKAIPDLLTFAKGATSGYAPIGGVLMRGPVMDEIMDQGVPFNHGATWGAHPVATATAVANITALKEEKVLDNVTRNQDKFRVLLDEIMANHTSVRDVRGMGYLYSIELTHNRSTGQELDTAQTAEAVNNLLPRLIREAGIVIRADDRGLAKLMLSPPLIAEKTVLEELCHGVDRVLSDFETWLQS